MSVGIAIGVSFVILIAVLLILEAMHLKSTTLPGTVGVSSFFILRWGANRITQEPTSKATTAHIRILFLTLIAASSQLLLAAPPAQEVIASKAKFATAGHPKAKGLVMTLEYPSSWAAKEGERPNIVQKFVRPGGLEMAAIITKALPLPPRTKIPEQELKEFFTPAEMKDMLPDGATFINAKPTKIEGLPAGILEYSMRQERAGMTVDMRFVAFIFVHDTTMVQLQYSVGALATQSASLPQRMSEFMPLFTLMANSIVLPDKWK